MGRTSCPWISLSDFATVSHAIHEFKEGTRNDHWSTDHFSGLSLHLACLLPKVKTPFSHVSQFLLSLNMNGIGSNIAPCVAVWNEPTSLSLQWSRMRRSSVVSNKCEWPHNGYLPCEKKTPCILLQRKDTWSVVQSSCTGIQLLQLLICLMFASNELDRCIWLPRSCQMR